MAGKFKRGSLIVFEGGDGAGKSTQVKRIEERLNEMAIRTSKMQFLTRLTGIGSIINSFLTRTKEQPSPLLNST